MNRKDGKSNHPGDATDADLISVDEPRVRGKMAEARRESSYSRNLERLIERIQSVCSGDDPSDYELKEIYDLASCGCGRVEIARIMGYEYNTAWKNPSIIKAFELGESGVTLRLRRAMLSHAMRGNTQVLLCMARNYLPDIVQDPNKPAQHLHLHGPEGGRRPMSLDEIKGELEKLGLPPPGGDDIIDLDAPVIDVEAARRETIDRTDRGLAKAKEEQLEASKALTSIAKKSRNRTPPKAPPVMVREDLVGDNFSDTLDKYLDQVDGMTLDGETSGK